MKQILFSFLIGIMITSIAPETALGDAWNTNRQWGSAASLNELQVGVFDAIGSSISAYGDQSNWAIFVPMAGGSSSATYVATISWYYPDIEFGIYDYGNSATQLKLFNESTATVGDSVTFEFNLAGNWVKSYDSGGLIDQTTWFGDFGFYAIGSDHQLNPIGPYFSEDDLNPYDDAHFLTYEAKGDNVTIPNKGTGSDAGHWYVASETDIASNRTANSDFTDFVVLVESIVPVPVPAAVLLGVLGLGVVGLKLRKYA